MVNSLPHDFKEKFHENAKEIPLLNHKLHLGNKLDK